MVYRNLAMALSLVGAIALPVSTTMAAGHGIMHKAQRYCTSSVVPLHGRTRMSRSQFEGTVVSVSSTPVVSGTTFVVKAQGSQGMTITIGIDSSTVITAGVGVTTTTLAVGEQVHVAARSGPVCTFTATRVEIQPAKSNSGHASDVGKMGGKGHRVANKRQLEGTIVSLSSTPVVSGTTLVLQAENIHGMTVTVGLTSSSVITADDGVTTTTLAVGEQVHVTVQADSSGMLDATLVVIQQATTGAHGKRADADHKRKH